MWQKKETVSLAREIPQVRNSFGIHNATLILKKPPFDKYQTDHKYLALLMLLMHIEAGMWLRSLSDGYMLRGFFFVCHLKGGAMFHICAYNIITGFFGIFIYITRVLINKKSLIFKNVGIMNFLIIQRAGLMRSIFLIESIMRD